MSRARGPAGIVRSCWLAAATALGLAACGGGEDDPIACTLEVRPAVVLTVADPGGALLSGVTVAWQVDGGPMQAVACDQVLPCAFGHEVAGSYEVTASKPGFVSASASVIVLRDACHVFTEQLTLNLRPGP
jgi:hypothetical protein